MTDYFKLGFRCGIEIHQQLEGKKLFCNCPALNSTKEPDIEVKRRLRASAGELGEIDKAAKYEMAKSKEFIYIGNSEDVCNVEMDEEPPHQINQDALNTALEVALLLKAKIVDEIQVMRKTVVDGSNTSGFQKTALIATGGYIETSKGKVRIPTICLEEEACQKIEETKEYTKYRLDRLGIPLIEIGTETDIKSPEHAKETASLLGMILRSTGKVKRGIGTIRQDVNISIKGGARTEIKGFQELKSIPKVIEYEIERQSSLINHNKIIEESVRKAEPNLTTSFLRPMPGSARMYPETDIPPVGITKERLSGIKLPKLISEKEKEFEKKYGLSRDIAKELINDELFEGFVKKYENVEPKLIANIMISVPKDIKTRLQLDASKITDADFNLILENLNSNKINKEAAAELLADICRGKKMDINKFKTVSEEGLEKDIKEIVKQKPGLSIGAYMGLIMEKHRGKVEGKKVMELLKRIV